ncbi:MAG: hypothetical protein ACUVXI_04160 [bacterium]
MGYIVSGGEEYLDSSYVLQRPIGGFWGRCAKDRPGGRIALESKLDLKSDWRIHQSAVRIEAGPLGTAIVDLD